MVDLGSGCGGCFADCMGKATRRSSLCRMRRRGWNHSGYSTTTEDASGEVVAETIRSVALGWKACRWLIVEWSVCYSDSTYVFAVDSQWSCSMSMRVLAEVSVQNVSRSIWVMSTYDTPCKIYFSCERWHLYPYLIGWSGRKRLCCSYVSVNSY